MLVLLLPPANPVMILLFASYHVGLAVDVQEVEAGHEFVVIPVFSPC